MSNDPLVSVEVAAESLSVSKFTLYKRAKRGEIPHYRHGKLLRFSVEELRDALRQPTGPATR